MFLNLKRSFDKIILDHFNIISEQALKVRRLVSEDFRRAFESGIDVLLTPVTLSTAPRYVKWQKKVARSSVLAASGRGGEFTQLNTFIFVHSWIF